VDSLHRLSSLKNVCRYSCNVFVIDVCLKKNGNLSTILVRLCNMKFHENLFNSFRVVKYEETEKPIEARKRIFANPSSDHTYNDGVMTDI
jgi:hypothetical protein